MVPHPDDTHPRVDRHDGVTLTTVMASEEPLNLQHMQVVEERGGAAYEARARTLALWEPLGTTVAHRRWEGHGQEGHTPDKSREGRRGRSGKL